MKSRLIMIISGCLIVLPRIGAQSESPPPAPEMPKVQTPGNQLAAQPNSWRARYELGPGDVISLSFYGRPDLNRAGLKIGPDGTISYLQASNIKVAGLSLDEARLALEQSLASQFRSPRIILIPQEVGSKRYTILGMVGQGGVAKLDRPMTLLEAVANAGGLVTGLADRSIVELADLDRSFISRKGARLPVNFRKLFLESEMSQNVEIEPDDFIYLASNLSNNYFIFGSVYSPGIQTLTSSATVAEAVTRRGGFSPTAWTDHILIVRGSLDKPKTYVVNLKAILAGKEKDFTIQPKDIVYVADRPWTKAEELLELVMRTFISSAATSLINQSVDPIITEPLIKTN